MLRKTLTTAQLSMFPRHASCWGCSCQTRKGQNQRQSSPTDTSQIPLLLIMKELSCSLYPITLWLSVGFPGKILWTNPYRKPKFTPQSVSFTLRCKELKQWFTSTSIEKCLLGKESSGAKESLQLHSLALPTICLQGQHLLMDLYSRVPSSWGTLPPTAMSKQNKGTRLLRWTSGRQVVYLWEAISDNIIWNKNALWAELCVCGKAQ